MNNGLKTIYKKKNLYLNDDSFKGCKVEEIARMGRWRRCELTNKVVKKIFEVDIGTNFLYWAFFHCDKFLFLHTSKY